MPHTQLPFWLAEALAAEQPAPPTPLHGNHEVDVCIVGGGFTGLWCAIHLKQADPALRVLVLEKGLCGSGASGRNGGCLLTWSAKYLTLKRLFGEQQAAWLVRSSEQAVHEIAHFCKLHDIEAQLRVEGTCYTATSEAQRGLMEPVLQELKRTGLNQWQTIEESELASQSGSHVHLEGLYSPHAGSVQPALLVRGLLRVARELGAEVYEGSPMQRLDAGQPARVQTPEAIVRARKVVLALNSAMTAHFREFRRSIVLVSSDMVITEPAPAQLAAQQMNHGRSTVDGRTFVHYYRSTPDGRLMLGKGGNRFAFANRYLADFDRPSRYLAPLTLALRRFFPALQDVPIAASWCGASDRSVDGLPFFGHWREQPNIVYGLGYSGNGVAQSWMGGQVLAALVRDVVREEDKMWRDCALVSGPRGYFPPEPFRWLGAMVVRNAIRRKERAEDEGRPVPWYDKRLARLADAAGKADK
ncbi:FAD-dependent oxidoreductase [Aeromonas aquatica]|uniref:FAD-dependent oxidoreductase n=1 Tax=Aeromonas aquatica TaxID=558964 RepID=UPI00286F1A9E|nr:FAD-dependent oxidoreductase [Aeromonas aquatica]